MIKSVYNYPISQLFDIEASVIYAVPRYQREYTWRKEHWENLFDDLFDGSNGYFLGSIICINQSDDALKIQTLEVIDGQQRLTTLSLLFAAIYDYLKNYDNDLDDDQKVSLINLKRKLLLKKTETQIRVVPQVQNNNLDDYLAVLSEIGIIPSCDIPKHAGNRRVFKAFRYFQDRIEKIENNNGSNISIVLDFIDKINQASLVKIEVANHSDAYTLFESLNNRGTPLTPIDLIKNKLLARLESIEPGKIDHYFGFWNKLLGYLGDDYAIQERFFRHYYNAFKDDLKAITQASIATRSTLMQIYEKLIMRDAKEFLGNIVSAGRLYSVMLFRNQDEAFKPIEKPLCDLDRIQGAPSYLLMLYLLARRDALRLNGDQLARIVTLLGRFFVRRNLTDTPPTRDLTRMFMAIIDKLSVVSGEAVIDVIRDNLIAVSSGDNAFRTKLEGPIYEENAGATRFILCALATQGMTKETWIDLWRFENKQFMWTIEHVFPQGENIPKEWASMIAGGDDDKAKEYQQSHVHKLGNLTISGFNSTLGNKSFEEKRDRTDREGRYVGYRNGLKLNEDLATFNTWSIEKIDERTKKLVDQAMALFKLDGE